MNRLFNRSWKLIVDDVEIRGDLPQASLDIAFKVETNTKQAPNKATVRVWNLNPDHRNQLQKHTGRSKSKKTIVVELHAGYADGIGIIFRGDVHEVKTSRDGADFVTEVSGTDGGYLYGTSVVSGSFAPGTRIVDVMRQCLKALGIGEGNLKRFEKKIKIKNLGTTFPEGYAVSGSAEKAFSNLVQSCDLRWSIQKGVLQLQETDQPVTIDAFELSADSGLIGTPVAEVDTRTKRMFVRAKTLMLHRLVAGNAVQIKSEVFNGSYEIVQLDFVGDSAGDDWGCDLALRQYRKSEGITVAGTG